MKRDLKLCFWGILHKMQKFPEIDFLKDDSIIDDTVFSKNIYENKKMFRVFSYDWSVQFQLKRNPS